MADKKISALTAATTPLAGTEVLPVVQGGSTVKVSVANLTAGRAVSADTLSTTGNVAFGGVTPSAWVVYDPGVIEKTYGAFWATFTDQSRFGLNAYYAYAWTYKNNGYSSLYEQTSGSHKFYTAPSGTAGNPITYTQALTVDQATNNVKADVGNFVVGTAGKGIDFSANGGDVLSQYDEGTFTPVFNNLTVGNATVNGRYTRIGRIVTISIELVFGTTSAWTGGSSGIAGLPYTSAVKANGCITLFQTGVGWSSGQIFMLAGQTQTSFPTNYAGAGFSATSPWTWGAGDYALITLVYEAL